MARSSAGEGYASVLALFFFSACDCLVDVRVNMGLGVHSTCQQNELSRETESEGAELEAGGGVLQRHDDTTAV